MVAHTKWTKEDLEEMKAELEDELKRALEMRPVEVIRDHLDAVEFLLKGFEERDG